jgi:hypothetical protein
MPFGKDNGVDLEDLPLDYLYWLTLNIELREPLRTTVAGELEARFDVAPRTSQRTVVKTEDVAAARGFCAFWQTCRCVWHASHVSVYT